MKSVALFRSGGQCPSQLLDASFFAELGCLACVYPLSALEDLKAFRSTDLFLLCYDADYSSQLEKIRFLRRVLPTRPLIVVVLEQNTQAAVWAARYRAWDCVVLPQEIEYLKESIRRALENRSRRGASPGAELPPRAPLRTAPALAYIAKSLQTPIRLGDLAAMCHMGVSTFSAVFKKEHGCSVFDYIKIQRISQAKRLLTESALAVKEIAFSCGYEDVSYFIRVFKSLEGVTPAAYRASRNNSLLIVTDTDQP